MENYNSSEKPVPIIVVGTERSGTKWLSNILCNHPEIIGVQSEFHQGIIETNMFGAMQQKFDLRFEDDYIGLIELWSLTDFFRATEVDKSLFYSLDPHPTSCIDLFKILMDTFAHNNDKHFWLQKCNAHASLLVAMSLGNARYVVITRDITDTLSSLLQNASNRRQRISVFSAVYSYIFHEKAMFRLMKQFQPPSVKYEDLKRDTEASVRGLCKSLGLKFDIGMLDIGFEKNSSFRSEFDRNTSLSACAKIAIVIYGFILRFFPLIIFQWLWHIKKAFVPTQSDPLVFGTFRSLVVQSCNREVASGDPDGSAAITC